MALDLDREALRIFKDPMVEVDQLPEGREPAFSSSEDKRSQNRRTV